jgi:hypothetical protein
MNSINHISMNHIWIESIITHSKKHHIWVESTITHSKKHWARLIILRLIISRSIMSESNWLSLIQKNNEFDQSYFDRSYLSRINYHIFEEVSKSIDHIWSRSTRSHSKEHQVWSIIFNFDRLDFIRKSIKFDRSYLILIDSILFKRTSSSISYIWSRSTRFYSKKHQIRVASNDTEAGLRQDHVMRLQSRDVTKMTVYRER